MSDKKEPTDVQSSENMRLQRKFWRIEKVIIGILLLFLLWAALGGHGNGPLSKAVAGEKGSDFWIEYQHMMHYTRPEQMKVYMSSPENKDTLSLWMDKTYLENIRIETIDPMPVSTKLKEDKTVFQFLAQPGQKSLMVNIFQKGNKFWKHKGVVGLEGGKSHAVWNIVYP